MGRAPGHSCDKVTAACYHTLGANFTGGCLKEWQDSWDSQDDETEVVDEQTEAYFDIQDEADVACRGHQLTDQEIVAEIRGQEESLEEDEDDVGEDVHLVTCAEAKKAVENRVIMLPFGSDVVSSLEKRQNRLN